MSANGQTTESPVKGGIVEAQSIGLVSVAAGSITGAGQTITPDLGTAGIFVITCTTTDAYTVANPVNGFVGQTFEIKFKNAIGGGGVMGTPTFGNAFKLGTFTKPADTKNRTLKFRFDGTNFNQHASDSDVAN